MPRNTAEQHDVKQQFFRFLIIMCLHLFEQPRYYPKLKRILFQPTDPAFIGVLFYIITINPFTILIISYGYHTKPN